MGSALWRGFVAFSAEKVGGLRCFDHNHIDYGPKLSCRGRCPQRPVSPGRHKSDFSDTLKTRSRFDCGFSFTQQKTTYPKVSGQWSGLRGSNSLPPPWQGGALPDELNPHIWLRMPTCISASGHQWSGLRGSNSLPPPWQGGALPDELNPRFLTANIEYQKAAGKSSLFFDFFEKFTDEVPKCP